MKHFTHFKSSILRGLLSLFFLTAMVSSAWGEEATMAAGTNGSAATVNEKDAIKVGTSKAGGGDMTITVPAGATSLELYAAAWNGVTGLSLNITPAEKVNNTSIALTADAGISNSSPFTLIEAESNYKFTISLKDITAETTLTFSSSSAKRFVVWGATYTSAADSRIAVNLSDFTTIDGSTTIVKGNTLATSVTNDQSDWTESYTYTSNDSEVATVSSDGVITAVAKGTATITASLNIASNDATYKLGTTTSKKIEITVNNPTHHYTFSANGTNFSEGDVEEGSAITFPTSKPEDVDNKTFVGWYSGDYSNATNAPTYVTSASMGENNVVYKAVYATATQNEEGGSYEFTYNSHSNWTISPKTIDNSAGNYYLLQKNDYIESPYISDLSRVTSIVVGAGKYNNKGAYTVESDNSSIGTAGIPSSTDSNSRTFSNLNLTGSGTIKVTNTDGAASGTTKAMAGTRLYTITINYGATITYSNFTTNVVIRTLTGISFGGALTKNVYTEEETFDPTGITVLASYENQAEQEDITDKVTLSYTTTPLTVGTSSVKVATSYKTFNIDKDYNITVNAIPTYTITACAASGGSYTVKIGDAEVTNVPSEGAAYQSRESKVITLTSTAAEGYKLNTTPFVVKDADNTAVQVSKSGDKYTFTMPAKAVTISAQYVQLFTIAITTPEHGTISSVKDNNDNEVTTTSKGSKVWVTVNPETHYTLSAISVKKADESDVTVTIDPENANRASFTMPQSNVTVSAVFAEDPKHNVTFYANSEACVPTSVYEGDAVVFPAVPSVPTGYVFLGWTTAVIEDTQLEAPALIKEATMEASDLAFYAVFAKTSQGEDASVDFTLTSITELSTSASQRSQSTNGITFTFSLVMDTNVSGTHYVQMQKSSSLTQDIPFAGIIKSISFENFGFSSTTNASMVVSGKNSADGDYAIVQSCDNEYKGADIDFSDNNYNMFKIEVGSERTIKYTKMTVTYSSFTYDYYCTTIPPRAFQATIAECGYTTVCLPYNATVEEGASAYALSEITAQGLVFSPVNAIKANEGYLIKGTVSQTYTLTESQESNDATNILKGVTDRVEVSTLGIQGAGDFAYPWILAKVGTFKKYTGEFIPANKAYLDGSYVATYVASLPSNSSELRVIFSDDINGNETAIPEIDPTGEVPLIIYTMTGIRIPKVVEDGLYIVNGKTKWMLAE